MAKKKAAKSAVTKTAKRKNPGKAGPNVRGAIGHALKAASSLVGDAKVVSFFREMVGRGFDAKVSKLIPGRTLAKKGLQKHIGDDVAELLTER